MDQQPPVPQEQPQPPQQSQPPVAPPQPPQPIAPPQPMAGQPVAPQPGVPMENPGQTLGIIGLVCNLLGVSIAGIVLGIMSRNKSKQYGMSTTLGTISLVWGIVATALAVLAFVLFVFLGILGATTSSDLDYDTSSSSSTYNYDY